MFLIIGAPSAATDKDLDIALGYFSNIEFATDLELSLSFAREMCHYIRFAIDRGNKYPQEGTSELKSKPDLASSSLNQMPNQVDFDSACLVPTVCISASQRNTLSKMNFSVYNGSHMVDHSVHALFSF